MAQKIAATVRSLCTQSILLESDIGVAEYKYDKRSKRLVVAIDLCVILKVSIIDDRSPIAINPNQIMPYSSFTIEQVQRQFQLNVATGIFFVDLPKFSPNQWLIDLLVKSVPFATTLGTEKVRSELIIAPLLFEFRELLSRDIGLFSGVDFTIAPELGLNGVCDFLLTRSSNEVIIQVPAIVIIEAKKGELNAGWGQCAAEMIAAQKFNQANGSEVATIYGCVTTGTQWQFLKLTSQDLTIDVSEYALEPIDRILGILKWMVAGDDQKDGSAAAIDGSNHPA